MRSQKTCRLNAQYLDCHLGRAVRSNQISGAILQKTAITPKARGDFRRGGLKTHQIRDPETPALGRKTANRRLSGDIDGKFSRYRTGWLGLEEPNPKISKVPINHEKSCFLRGTVPSTYAINLCHRRHRHGPGRYPLPQAPAPMLVFRDCCSSGPQGPFHQPRAPRAARPAA